jgi:curli biogenesis system outer membrane secretion channel CsgG
MQLTTRILAALICAGFLASCASATTPSWSYENRKVTDGEFPIRTACMMPVEGKLSKVTMKGGAGMSKESDNWTTTLENMVEAHLKTAGVQIFQANDPLASGASDDEIQQVILQLNQKYGDIAKTLNKKPKDIGKSRYTIGDEAALLPCAAKADVLVFVEGEGQVTSGGKKAMGMLVTTQSNTSYATLILTMADAKTGEIIAFSRMSNAESFGEKFVDQTEEVYGKALNKQFERLRIGMYIDKKKR